MARMPSDTNLKICENEVGKYVEVVEENLGIKQVKTFQPDITLDTLIQYTL